MCVIYVSFDKSYAISLLLSMTSIFISCFFAVSCKSCYEVWCKTSNESILCMVYLTYILRLVVDHFLSISLLWRIAVYPPHAFVHVRQLDVANWYLNYYAKYFVLNSDSLCSVLHLIWVKIWEKKSVAPSGVLFHLLLRFVRGDPIYQHNNKN